MVKRRRRLVLLTMCAMMVAVVIVSLLPAAASAATQNYSILLPTVARDYWTTAKTVNAGTDFGVRHRYSGGKTVHFLVCNTSHEKLGSEVAIAPGGAYATLTDLWWNNTGASKSIVVRMESPWNCFVTILAEGTWAWNY
jgi:hypothetical protein